MADMLGGKGGPAGLPGLGAPGLPGLGGPGNLPPGLENFLKKK